MELSAALSSGEISMTFFLVAEYCGITATLNPTFTIASLDLQMQANLTREESVADEVSVVTPLRVGDIRIYLGDAQINGVTIGTGNFIQELLDEYYSNHTDVPTPPATH